MQRPHIAILGAGPIGLEAALAAVESDLPFTLYEAGARVAANVRAWGHVRLFTPWDMNVSPRGRRHLEAAGLQAPAGAECPTGAELCARLLEPLAALPAVAPHLRLGLRARAIGREGLLKHEEIATAERGRHPFRLLLTDGAGAEWAASADLVLDCTGCYGQPNSLGDGGIPAPGERALEERLTRFLPDFDRDVAEWAGRAILLAGAGHSAQTAACDLDRLASAHPGTRVVWVLRREHPTFAVAEDPLPERAQLAACAQALADGGSPVFDVRRGAAVEALEPAGDQVRVTLRRGRGRAVETVDVDRVLSLTGGVPDQELYRQLQVHECYATAAPMKLSAALLAAGGGGADCLAQTSHGVDTLTSPEPGFFILGAKSYGRNPTFLLRVGYEQVEEVFASLR